MTFQTRIIDLRSGREQQAGIKLLVNIPLREKDPLQLIIREKPKARKLEQNSLMWSALNEIADQAWVEGKQFSADVWHIHFKTLFLPEEFEEGMTRERYKKWDYTPAGDRVLVGSTTQLTTKGFGTYMEQVFAFGADLGVMFRAAA